VKNLLCCIALIASENVAFGANLQHFIEILPKDSGPGKDILLQTVEHEGKRHNTCSLDALTKWRDLLRSNVANDNYALEAIELLARGNWNGVLPLCRDGLCQMNKNNKQWVIEALALLAPVIGVSINGQLSDYASCVVSIVGKTDMTKDFFKYKSFLFDLFFFGAVVCGQLDLFPETECCVKIATWLQSITYEHYPDEFEQHSAPIDFSEYPRRPSGKGVGKWGDVYLLAFGGRCTEASIGYFPECVWPSLKEDG
jgi:hypothetical protein